MPCYDVVSTYCGQFKDRIDYVAEQGPPVDMKQTFSTLIHVAPKFDVQELKEVRGHLSNLLGHDYVAQADAGTDIH